MTLKLTWYDDLKAESDMRRMGVVFTIRTIPVSKIDYTQSQENRARLKDVIREHKVTDYMEAMRNGDTFPRVIVYLTPTGYVILSGNQRCEAIRRLIALRELEKSVTIEAYVIDDTTDDLLRGILAKTANVAHGEGDSKDERMAHACHYVSSKQLTAKDAALYFIVSESGIRVRLKAEEERKSLMRAGIDTQHLPNSVLEPLSKLTADEACKRQLGHLIAQHHPTAERVKQVAATVAKQTSTPARIAKIKEFEKELAAEAHASNGKAHPVLTRVPSRPLRERALRYLSAAVNFFESDNAGEPFRSIEELQITSGPDRERFISLAKKLRYRLGVIAK